MIDKKEIKHYIWLEKSKFKGILRWFRERIWEDKIRLIYREKFWSFKKQMEKGILND